MILRPLQDPNKAHRMNCSRKLQNSGLMEAKAREFSRTQRTAVYDIKLFDDRNNLIASCEALVYRKGNPLPFLKE